MGAKIYHSVTLGRGPPCFRIHGQNYHQIGSLLPLLGKSPKFLQLYVYDTENEISNQMQTMSQKKSANKIQEDACSCGIA